MLARRNGALCDDFDLDFSQMTTSGPDSDARILSPSDLSGRPAGLAGRPSHRLFASLNQVGSWSGRPDVALAGRAKRRT